MPSAPRSRTTRSRTAWRRTPRTPSRPSQPPPAEQPIRSRFLGHSRTQNPAQAPAVLLIGQARHAPEESSMASTETSTDTQTAHGVLLSETAAREIKSIIQQQELDASKVCLRVGVK